MDNNPTTNIVEAPNISKEDRRHEKGKPGETDTNTRVDQEHQLAIRSANMVSDISSSSTLPSDIINQPGLNLFVELNFPKCIHPTENNDDVTSDLLRQTTSNCFK